MRIFLSIPVPNVLKNIKQMLTSTCENERVEIRWVKHNNLHLTVQFLGSVSYEKVAEIRKEVENVVCSINPFVLNVNETGCFPNISKPPVLYLGVGGNIEALKALVVIINDKMSQIGFKKKSELFIPHWTLRVAGSLLIRSVGASGSLPCCDVRLGWRCSRASMAPPGTRWPTSSVRVVCACVCVYV